MNYIEFLKKSAHPSNHSIACISPADKCIIRGVIKDRIQEIAIYESDDLANWEKSDISYIGSEEYKKNLDIYE